jgi:vancomycin resistance protein VanJ
LREKRLLLLQAVSAFLVIFPLMGLCIGWASSPAPGVPRLRIFSHNTDSARGGVDALIREIQAKSPDLVFLQELPNFDEVRARLTQRYPHTDAQGEFVVASKFPIVEAQVPDRLAFYDQRRSPRFMRVVIDTSLGRITFFHVHTVSPRGGFYELRGRGFRREIASGRLFTGENADGVRHLAELRELQITTMSRLAAREKGPVVIVGDTNLPGLSPVRRENLARFRDGFAAARTGFGYTFPAKSPWMRIDLMLSSEQLTFVDFEVGTETVSDHRSISAELVSDR